MLKKFTMLCLVSAMMVAMSISVFAIEDTATQQISSHTVTRVDIPNRDGTFTTLEGQAARDWYDRVKAEGQQRMQAESQMNLAEVTNEAHESKGSFVASILIISLFFGIIVDGKSWKKI